MDAQQVAEMLAAHEAEVERQRMQDQASAGVEIPRSPYAQQAAQQTVYEGGIKRLQDQIARGRIEQIGNGPLTPAAPINDRIRNLSGEVANAADVLAQRRQEAESASRELFEAESNFATFSAQLAKLLEECRAMGLNAQRAVPR